MENKQKETVVNPEDKAGILKFPPPETPEEYYQKGQKYLVGAKCALPFQERAKYLRKAAEMFAGAGEYLDAPALSREYARTAADTLEEGYRAAYDNACARKAHAKTQDDYFLTARAFERISGYKDADALGEACEKKLRHMKARKIPIAFTAVLFVIALIVGCVFGAQTDAFRYQLGNLSCAVGVDSVGVSFYRSALGYRDAADKLEQCYYKQGKKAFDRNDYASAVSHFSKMEGEYADSATLNLQAEQQLLQDAQAGDKVSYAGDQWIVLDKQNGTLLLLHKKALEGLPYNLDRNENVDWETSDLRGWLNGSTESNELYLAQGDDFLSMTFSQAELDCLRPDAGGNLVSLLSAQEYERYSEQIISDGKPLGVDWWLRDAGQLDGTAMFVAWDGSIMDAGYAVDSTVIQTRPTIRVSLQKEESN